jgi:glyoxylase-like metal-dependent hydrolase (beta-lactamase superfamily II)
MGITPLGGGVIEIDTRQSGYQGITAAYLITGPRPCLVETGTATSADTVIAALHEIGLSPDDLASVVVSHIHLDHAGGAGHLTRAFPNAHLYVQERGARHLVDPSKLIASARRVFGDAMDLLGEIIPTASERVHALAEGDRIDLGGGRHLESFHAPGHASHHIGLMDTSTGDLFVGDAAGVYIPESGDVRPATAPPEFDFALAEQTLAKFRERKPTRLLFSHYGPVLDVPETLERSLDELRRLVSDVREARESGHDLDHAVAMIVERTNQRLTTLASMPEVQERFAALNTTAANVVGVNRWLNSVEEPQYDFGDAAP